MPPVGSKEPRKHKSMQARLRELLDVGGDGAVVAAVARLFRVFCVPTFFVGKRRGFSLGEAPENPQV